MIQEQTKKGKNPTVPHITLLTAVGQKKRKNQGREGLEPSGGDTLPLQLGKGSTFDRNVFGYLRSDLDLANTLIVNFVKAPST